jgi:hypothetical protein
MSKIDCKVIVCGPAIGKTYLAEHDKRFIDLDQLKSNYKYGLDFLTLEDKEKDKGNSKKFIEEMTNKKEWEQFYISNVSDLSAAYKIELKKGQYFEVNPE